MSGIRIKSRTLLAPATPNASKNPLLAAQVSVFTSMIVDSFFSNENDIHGVLPSIIALSQCIKFGWIPSYISKVHRFIMPIVCKAYSKIIVFIVHFFFPLGAL
jgi:hypothetical protein